MKVKVTKYHPTCVDVDEEISEVLYITNKYDIFHKIDYLKDKIGKLRFVHNSLTNTLITYDKLENNEAWPIAYVELLEI